MSLPIPTTKNSNRYNPREVQAIDAPLVALTQQCSGDLRQLLTAFFSFLNRRTDFYLIPHPEDVERGLPSKMGFKEGDAEKMLLAAFRQFPLRRIPKGGVGVSPPKPNSKKTAAEKTVKSKNEPKDPSTGPSNSNVKTKSNDEKKDKPASSDNHVGLDEENVASNMRGIQYNEEGLQIPVGNGGSTPRYKWTQTIDEVTVLVGIPQTLRGKDFDVSITPSKLSIKAKKPLPGGPTTFVKGELTEKIRADESTWSIEGGVMIVTLDKLEKKFWRTVLTGDEEIDVELVDSRRHISDYDNATQAQFRKIIFDQNQYHLGLPSSDEILGRKPDIPDLPAGVEYIDKKKLDEGTKGKGGDSKIS